MNTPMNIFRILGKILSVFRFFKKNKKLAIIGLVGLGFVLFFVFRGGDEGAVEIVKARIGSVAQEVSITGRVKATQGVDLAFDRSGRVSYVGARNGDIVHAGKLLVQLDVSELLAQEQREKANVAAAELRLNQLLNAGSDRGDNGAAVGVISKALKSTIDSMVDFTSVQYSHFNSNTSESNQISDSKDAILKLIYGQSGLGRVEASYFLSLSGGLKSRVDEAEKGSGQIDYDLLVGEVKSLLIQTRNGLELMRSRLAGIGNSAASDAGLIVSSIDALNNHIISLNAQDKSLVGEGYDVEIAKSQLEQAKASLAVIQAQVSKYRLIAPFSGIVGNVDVRAGEIVSPNIKLVSLMSNANFQIEANVSEADIAKISIGDTANVRLDAYGKDNIFTAKLIGIDPGGKLIDGVATYKVTLEFDVEDPRILSGLTADVDILADERKDVLFVPTREIIVSKDGKKYVKVKVSNDDNDDRFANLSVTVRGGDYKILEVPITTGLKGSDGRTEILSGLNEGDVIFSN